MSLYYLHCEVCASSSKTLIRISDVHQNLINQVYGILNLHMKIVPNVCCDNCFFRLLSLDDLIRKVLHCHQLQQLSKEEMQTGPFADENKQNPIEEVEMTPKILVDESAQDSDEIKHEYNCDCEQCQIKYGSLPLLVQVIEGQEKQKIDETSSSEETKESIDISSPSTSGYGRDKCSTSRRKEMKCSECGKIFTHKGDMNKHLRKHTGEQPFPCPICDKKFAHTSNLTRHLKVHSGEKPFTCENCGKSFSRKDKLQLHQKTKLCQTYHEAS